MMSDISAGITRPRDDPKQENEQVALHLLQNFDQMTVKRIP